VCSSDLSWGFDGSALRSTLLPLVAPSVKPPARLDSQLDAIRRSFAKSGQRVALQTARESLVPVRDGAVLVEIQTAPGRRGEAVRGLEAIGVRVHSWYANLLAAYAPPTCLDRLSGVAGVQRAAAAQPMWTDEVTSQGVAETNANAWQAAGYDGTGAKIGIIDVGFTGYTSLLGGELPASGDVVAWGAGSGGGENGGNIHGTAVAEIVHDVAPGAKLYIARVATVTDIGNAKDWMVAQGVKVINTSLGRPEWGPGDGSGQANTIVAGAVSSGVFWACSAGNDRQSHWMGDFTDADSNGVLN
jgi:hypothetical protein